MKTAIKVILASALTLSIAAPTVSHAAYFVNQTKTWTNARAQDVGDKVTRHKKGATHMQGSKRGIRGFYGTDNTSVPGASVDK